MFYRSILKCARNKRGPVASQEAVSTRCDLSAKADSQSNSLSDDEASKCDSTRALSGGMRAYERESEIRQTGGCSDSPPPESNNPPEMLPEDVDPDFRENSSKQTGDPPSLVLPQLRHSLADAWLAPPLPIPLEVSAGPSASVASRPDHISYRYRLQWPVLPLEPQTNRPIIEEDVNKEARSIYCSLTEVEAKCIKFHSKQQATPRSEFTNEQWQVLAARHRALLDGYHDFFRIIQHPAASLALQREAARRLIPERFMKHGIHPFLELLRRHLPDSREHMVAFACHAYRETAVFYESVPIFREAWIELLGDLCRCQMYIAVIIPAGEMWGSMARGWYNKAVDANPGLGRLSHHIAATLRPLTVRQLYFLNRSLTTVVPYITSREVLPLIVKPEKLNSVEDDIERLDIDLVKIHTYLLKKDDLDPIQGLLDSFTSGLPPCLSRLGHKWTHTGAFIAIANFGLLFDFGNQDSRVRFIFDSLRRQWQLDGSVSIPPDLPDDQSVLDPQPMPDMDPCSAHAFGVSIQVVVSITRAVLSCNARKRILPFVHITLVFLLRLSQIEERLGFRETSRPILEAIPWSDLASFMNALYQRNGSDSVVPAAIAFDVTGRPLPEDWMLRGLCWSFGYMPNTWFENSAVITEEERSWERRSTNQARVDRVLSLGVALAAVGLMAHLDITTTDGAI